MRSSGWTRAAWGFGVSAFVAAAACAPRDPSVVAPNATSAPTALASARPPTNDAVRGPFELLWAAPGGSWNYHVAFSPTGDVVVVDGESKVHLLDAATGKERSAAKACPSYDVGFGAIDGGRFGIVCADDVRSLDTASLRASSVMQIDVALAAHVAIDPRLCVVSDTELVAPSEPGSEAKDERRVRLLDPRKWKQLTELRFGQEDMIGVAASPDGVGFALSFDRRIELRESPTGRVLGTIAGRSRAMAYSPDGKLLFAEGSNFEAFVVDLATRQRVRTYREIEALSQARWLSSGAVVASGEQGLWLFSPNGAKAQARAPGEKWTGEGLAVSADGKLACVGDRKSTIRMFRIAAP